MGIALAAAFVFAMMSNPVFATSPDFRIVSGSGFSMTVEGTPGDTESDVDSIYVYAFFTQKKGKTDNSFVAYVAASHDFDDDPEQTGVGDRSLHGHFLELNNNTLCIQAITTDTTASVSGSTVTINGAHGKVVNYVTAVYSITGGGICPVHVFDII